MSEAAGTLELVPTPLTVAVSYATNLAQTIHRNSLHALLPKFNDGYSTAQLMATAATMMRNEMPVLDEVDLEAFKTMLVTQDMVKWEEREIEAQHLTPLQRQIYFDKAASNTIAHGPEKTCEFLKANHLYVSEEGCILDGHHRWLSAMLIDPSFKFRTLVVDADSHAALVDALQYSDSKGHERNA
jgi:hypothetical protein